MANLRRCWSIDAKADAGRAFLYNASVYNFIRRKSPCNRVRFAENWNTALISPRIITNAT
jgi:hypothetical protein